MMRPSRIGFSALLVSAAILLMLSGCHRLFCSDSAGPAIVSPNGRYIANIVQSACGANEQVTFVELRRNRALLKDRRSVFVIEGFQTLGVAWRDKHNLAIVAPSCEGKGTRLWNWNDVKVQCEVAGKGQ